MEKYLELKLQQKMIMMMFSKILLFPLDALCLIQSLQFSIILFRIFRLDESNRSQANTPIRVLYPSELCVSMRMEPSFSMSEGGSPEGWRMEYRLWDASGTGMYPFSTFRHDCTT